MNLGFIGKIAKKYPSLARLVELSIYSAALSTIDIAQQQLLAGEIDLKQTLLIFIGSFGVALQAGIGKQMRDNVRKIEEELKKGKK